MGNKIILYCIVIFVIYLMICCVEGSRIQKRQSSSSELHTCHQQSLACGTIRAGITPHFDNVLNTSVVPVVSESKFNTICQIHSDADQCYQNVLFKQSCTLYYRFFFNYISYKEYNDTYTFLCNTKQEYLDGADCFSNHNVTNGEKLCSETYRAQMVNLGQQLRDPNVIRDKLCSHINDYLVCLETSTVAICNATTALWLRVLYTKNLEPTFSRIGCVLDTSGYAHFDADSQSADQQSTTTLAPKGTSPFGAGAILGVSIALVLILLGIIFLLYLRHRYSKKTPETRAANNRGLPNYYGNSGPAILYNRGATGGDDVIKGFPYGPSNEELPPKMGDYPPPTYSSEQCASAPFPDSRNNLVSPPPPYAPEDDGYCNPLYENQTPREHMANVN